MATLRQKRVAQLIVENATLDKPLNAKQMLEKVSYGKISKQPSRILESEGVLEELEVLGFTENNAKRVVSEIMLNKEADNSSRLKATDQVFKVKGSYAATETINKNLNVEVKIENKELEAIRMEFEEKLKAKLTA